MDYDVPSVDKCIEEGLNEGGGNYDGAPAAAKMVADQWEVWEVLDDRTVGFLEEAIDQLNKIKRTVESVLDENGEYDWSDDQPSTEDP